MDYYKGYKGALRYISDITNDYDNNKTVEGLKELIDEVREETLKALEQGDNYNPIERGIG